MKYKCCQIRPVDVEDEHTWSVSIYSIDGEREEGNNTPHPMGYYYFPETETNKQAFEKLKQVMIKSHQERIECLQKSICQLEKLSYER